MGHSTQNLNFFVTSSVTHSLTLSQGSGSGTSSLMNKLISLSSEGKFSIIDSVVDKVSKGQLSKKKDASKGEEEEKGSSSGKPLQTTKEFEDLMAQMKIESLKDSSNSKFEVIEEVDEDAAMAEIDIIEKADSTNLDAVVVEEEEKESHRLKLEIVAEIDMSLKKARTVNATCHTWFIVKDKGVPINWKKPLLQKSQITSQITIAEQPFAEGAMRYAFLMLDKELGEHYVVKVPKNVQPASYNLEEMKNDIEAMFVCSHIVSEFNERLIAYVESRYLVEFVHSFLYEILDESAPYKYYYGENFIKGRYEKYNNNAGWTNGAGQDANQSLIAQALSHYSWQLTQGYLMIVDLQGVGNILTDPQIHCLDKARFGKGNLGYQGMLMFFNTHQCNEHCEKLGLVNPRLTDRLPSDFQLIAEPAESELQMRGNTHVNKLCDLCRKPFVTSFEHYATQRNEGKELWCDDCTSKRQKSMKAGTCEDCGKGFKSSAYWFLMKKTDFPVKCSGCRLANRERMRRELYGEDAGSEDENKKKKVQP